MKKFIAFFGFLLLCLSANAGGDKFVESLRNCSPYQDSGVMNVNGIDVKTSKQMIGWQNDKCVYKENLIMGTNNISTSCRFTKPQIQEIVSVADAYYLTLKYSNEEIDISSTEAVKNNPVVQVLNKYLQDSSVCQIDGLE